MMKKLVFLAIAALIVLPLILMIGCSGGGSTNPITLVPQKANMVGEVNLAKILSDEDFADIYDRLPKKSEDPQTLDDVLDAFQKETDIDLRQFDGGVFFGDVSQSGGDGSYFGIIVKGDFNKNDLLSALEDNIGENLDTVGYKGYEIYTGENEQAALCFLSDKMLVIGGMTPVKDVIQVKEGDREALSGEVLDTFNGLGDALIKVASVVTPSQTGESLPSGLGEFQLDLSAFSDVEKAGLVLAKEAQVISLKADLYFANSKSAEDAEKVFSLINVLAYILPIPEQGQTLVQDLLNKLQVEREDKLLTISIEMTVSEIEDMIESGKTS